MNVVCEAVVAASVPAEDSGRTAEVSSDWLPAESVKESTAASLAGDDHVQLPRDVETEAAVPTEADGAVAPKKRRRQSRFHPEPQEIVAAAPAVTAVRPVQANNPPAATATDGIVAAARDRLAAQLAAAAQAAADEEEAASAAKAAAKAAAPPPAWALRLSGENSVLSKCALAPCFPLTFLAPPLPSQQTP